MGVWKREWKNFLAIAAVFLVCYYLPVGTKRFDNAVLEAFHLVKWYAQEHVLLCLVPAFFIAGAVGVFVSQASVMKYLGAKANKVLAYGVAAVSGTILAVCSCTILPLFSGIYRMGAGLGPACAFLYSGPAINVLAIVLTARVLGLELGIARAVGAVIFSIVIGLLMHFIFRREEEAKAAAQMAMPEPEIKRNLLQNGLYFASMVGILVFANWGKPQEAEGLWVTIYNLKWVFTGVFYLIFSVILSLWFGLKPYKAVASVAAVSVAGLIYPDYPLVPFTVGSMALVLFTSTQKGELSDWFDTSWDFAKKILPLLLFGVVIAGALLGRVDNEGLIPSEWIAKAVGGNSLWANFFASFAGAFMYFATLTEVPILQGLIGSGMGKGPALALLLAGPALSLPSMLVIRSVLGTKKTVVFVSLVIFMATLSGMIFGSIFS
ncbi:MAG: putative permease [bacterium ADurb.Bin157]|nr:MAG: putative permease [bacterium ADurb.Bin157]